MKCYPALFLFAAAIFSLGSCTKELSRENPVAGTSDSANFFATINGVVWHGDSLQQATVSDTGTVTITGVGRTQDEISILLPALQKGVFSVNSTTPGLALYDSSKDGVPAELYLSNGSTDASKAGGTVTITDIDTVNKTISGTFQFNLYQVSDGTTKVITAGGFNKIPYSGGGNINPGGPSGGGTGADSLSATINGTFWSPVQIVAATQSGILIIGGTGADNSQLIFYVPAAVTAGTYTLNYSGATYFATYNPDPSTLLAAQGNGSITITENDTVNKHIKGSFSFVGVALTGSGTANITNGYFSLSYD